MRMKPLVIAVIALLTVSLSGCRDSRELPVGADGKPQVTIMVGGIDKVIYLPAILTERLGGFRAQGLDVELLSQPAGATAETALLAGEVAGVIGFYDHTIDLQAKDQCITSIAQLANVPGEVEMVASSKAQQIRSWADMRGKSLGITSVGSSTDFLSKALAAKAGVAPGGFTPVKAGAGQTFIAGLRSNGFDAGMTTDPTVAQLTNTGQGRILTDMRTVKGTEAALGGVYPSTSLYMKCEIVQRYPDIAQKLANAFVGTLHWISQHSPQEIAARMPPSFAAGGKDLYVKSIADSIGMFNADGKMDPAGARNVLRILASFSKNVAPRKNSIDLGKTYTTRFVDKVR